MTPASGLILLYISNDEIVDAWASAGASEIAGYSFEEIASDPKKWIDSTHPTGINRTKQAMEEAVQGRTSSYECELTRKDGHTRLVREEWILCPSSQPNMSTIACMMLDLSHRIPEAEWVTVFKHMIDDSPLPVTIRDMSGVMLYCNSACTSFYGFDNSRTAVGSTLSDIIPDPYINDFYREILPQCHAGSWKGEVTVVRADGKWATINVTTNLLRDANGNPTASYSFFEDVDDQIKAKRALQESEEKYRNLVERSNDGVVVIQDAILKFVNPRFVELSGYGKEQLIGSHLTTYLPPSEAQILLDRYNRRMAENGAASIYETVMTRADGTQLQIEINAGIISYEGRPADLILLRDITARVEARKREERHTSRIASLAEIGQQFVSSLDSTSIMATATQVTADTLQCLCVVLGTGADNRKLHYKVGSSDASYLSIMLEHALEVSNLTLDSIFDSDVPQRLSGDMSQLSAEFSKESRIGPYILLPLYAERNLAGLLAAFRMENQPQFDDDDCWFISEVTSHTSAALTNAFYYNHQKTIADTLQTSMIPASPTIDGMDIATYYSPATEGIAVGGDFFDIISFQDGRVGIVVGDVSGKGIGAAIHTAEAKYMLRGFALQDPSPGYVITSLNEGLRAFISEETFVTLIYVLIDPRANNIQYVSAGHEPALILNKTARTVNELPASGPILGVTKGWKYETESASIGPNDYIFCYTDGLTDVRMNGGRFGYDRLTRAVIDSADLASSEEMIQNIVTTVMTAGNNQQPDDQVIVTVHVNG